MANDHTDDGLNDFARVTELEELAGRVDALRELVLLLADLLELDDETAEQVERLGGLSL